MESEFLVLGFMSIIRFVPMLPVVLLGIVDIKKLLLLTGAFVILGLIWIVVCWVFSDLRFIQIVLLEDIKPSAIKRGISVSYVMVMVVIELLPFAVARTIVKGNKKPVGINGVREQFSRI
jgi:hypothetical protein